MPIEKTLLLKGIAGVAVLGGVGGVGIAYKTGAFKSREEIEKEEKAKEEKKKLVNDKLSQLGIEGCNVDTSNFTSTTAFSKDCELDQDKFKKIKFSNKGDNEVNVAGWTNGNITLNISNKPGEENGIKFLFKNAPSDLIITKSSTDHTDKFSIKANKETEFEEKSGKLSKIISDQATSTKLKDYNSKLETLSIPQTCRLDVTEDESSMECSISKEQLKKIKFWNKGEQDLTITEDADLTELKLAISRKGTNDLKYVFKDLKKKIVLSGKDNKSFTLKQNTDAEFELRGGVLGRPRNIGESAKKVNLKCEYDSTNQGNTGTCTLEDNKNQISVSSNGSTSAGISFTDGSENAGKKSQVSFEFSEYEYDYEGDVKFTYRGETLNAGVNNEKLEKDVSYGVKAISKGATHWLVKKTSK